MGNETASALARRRLGLPSNGRIVLYAGAFGAENPLDLLIDAAPEVMERIRVVHFVLIGDGIARRHLEALARDRSLDAAVIFAGRVGRDQLVDHVLACDVGLTLSACFGSLAHRFSPEEVMPFLNAGRPVVAASDLPDARRFVLQNDIGCVAELSGRRAHDVGALTLALCSMLDDDRARARCAENSRRMGWSLAKDRSLFGLLRASVRRAAAF